MNCPPSLNLTHSNHQQIAHTYLHENEGRLVGKVQDSADQPLISPRLLTPRDIIVSTIIPVNE